MVINGACESLSWVSVGSDGAERIDASAYTMMTSYSFEENARKNVSDSFLSIGPAAERGIIFSALQGSRRAVDYEKALGWLTKAGLIYMEKRLRTQRIPTSAYEDDSIFKIYMLDIGLLAAQSRLRHESIISDTDVLIEFKGALAEQYAYQELVQQEGLNLHYYTNDNSTGEVEFIIDDGLNIVPLEIKSGTNVHAKSLKAYMARYAPRLALRASMRGYEEQDGLISLPLYELSDVSRIIRERL